MFTYRAFLSYSTDPDYVLARDTERFLEGFHKQIKELPDGAAPAPLQVCRDGSDFSIASIRREAASEAGAEDLIRDKIREYLAKSEYLILFCSHNSAKSPYVDFEARWFLENRPDKILLVVTEGTNPENARDVFPSSILASGLDRSIYFDFRGWKPSNTAQKVRDYQDAKVNVASHLYGFTEGQVLPLWLRMERERARRRLRAITLVSAALLGLFAASTLLYLRTRAQNQLLRSDLLYRESQQVLDDDVARSIHLALQAIRENPSNHARGQLFTALNTVENLKRILNGHQGAATRVLHSADGEVFYSVDAAYELVVWDARTYRRRGQVSLPHAKSPVLQFSSGANSIPYMGATDIALSGGSIFVSSAEGELIVLSDTRSRVPVVRQRLRQELPILSVTATTDHVYAGDDGGVITRYRRQNQRFVRDTSWRAHDGPVYDIAATDRYLASGGGDGIALAWQLPGIERYADASSYNGIPYYAVAFHPNGRTLALSGNYGKLELLDLTTKEITPIGDQLPDRVQCLSFHPSGLVLAACADNTIALIDVPRRSLVRTLAGHTRPASRESGFQQVSNVSFSRDGRDIISVGYDGRVFVRDASIYTFGEEFFNISLPIPRPALSRFVTSFDRNVEIAGVLRDGALLMRSGRALFRYHPETRTRSWIYSIPDTAGISTVQIMTAVIAVGGKSGRLIFLDASTFELVTDLGIAHKGPVCCVRESSPSTIVSASETGQVFIWRLAGHGRPERQELQIGPGEVRSLAVSPDRRSLFIGTESPNRFIRYSFGRAEFETLNTRQEFPLWHFAFGPDDEHWASGSSGGEITFWEQGTKGLRETAPRLRGHEYALKGLEFSRPSALFVSLDEKALCVWQARAAELIGCIPAPNEYTLNRMVVDQNSPAVYFMAADRFVYRLSLDPQSWTQAAERIVGP